MAKNKIKKKILAGVSILAGAMLISAVLILWNPLNKWQLKLTNRFYDRNEPSDEIVIVAIDDGSISDVEGGGNFWNWRRTYYAQVVENLEKAGASVIGIDVFFTTESTGVPEEALQQIIESNPTLTEYLEQTAAYLNNPHPDDAYFAGVLEKYNNIILDERLITPEKDKIDKQQDVLEIFKENVQTASVLVYPDEDDIYRRVQAEHTVYDTGETFESFGLKVAKNVKEDIPDYDELIVNYAAPPYSYKMISFADVYNGSFEEEEIKDKIILIGATSKWIEDRIPTPTSSEIQMPGVEFRANEIQTLLEGNFLIEQSAPSQIITILVLSAVLIGAVMLLSIIPGLLAAVGLIAAYHLAAEPIFDRGLIVNLVYPTIALFTAYLATTLYKYVTETKEKQELRSAFAKYVYKELVNQIMQNPEMLKLGGEKKTITAFFSDIENFTHFSEQSTPEALVSQLNQYFEVMTGIVLKNGGTLNKFEGDAIMAFWGAPLDDPQHAVKAAASAIECRVALRGLHETWKTEGKPLLEFRVGLASGEVIAGNVGSLERFDYTVMGDIVNLGARLESANKRYGTRIMASDATIAAMGDGFEVRRLDRLRVKGKDKPVDVYEILAHKGQLQEKHRQIIDAFHQAIEYYRNGKFEEAQKRFEQVAALAPSDGPTQTYLQRCAEFIKNPPSEWDGTWTLEHK